MATSTLTLPKTRRAVADATGREQAFRKVLAAMAVVVGFGLLAHLALILWARHEFSPVESLVGIHSNMLFQKGTLYYDLNRYPFTVTPYGPIFYALSGWLHNLGVPMYPAGRSISFCALVMALWLVWRSLGYLGLSLYARATGVILAASTSNILNWGTVGQVDMLACAFSLCAVTAFLRFREQKSFQAFILAGVFVILAILTKQTSLAAGLAIGATLLIENRKRAWPWIACVTIAGLQVALAINLITSGRYFADAISANINPFAAFKFFQHFNYFVLTGAGVIITVLAGTTAWSRKISPLYTYAGFCTLIWAATASKTGSDLNYQVEMMFALAMCAGAALDRLKFFESIFHSRRNWVTLLQMPLLFHVLLNVVLTGRIVLERAVMEPIRAKETLALAPFVNRPGRILSVHYDSLATYRGDIEVEPFIYSVLVDLKLSNPYPVIHDIQEKQFAAVLLAEDIFVEKKGEPDPEAPYLTGQHMAALRANYKLTTKIDGPYGIYVYEPIRN